jgi:hypothetical protein
MAFQILGTSHCLGSLLQRWLQSLLYFSSSGGSLLGLGLCYSLPGPPSFP